MRRAASSLAFVVTLLVGCYSENPIIPSVPAITSSAGPTVPVTTPEPSLEPTGSPGPPLVAPVAVAGELLYYCTRVPFPLSALAGPGGDEMANHPAAEGLRRSMATVQETIPDAPAHGWHYLGESQDVVEFAQWSPVDSGDGGTGYSVVLEREHATFYILNAWGGCNRPRLAAQAGNVALEWFAPTPPTPSATEVTVELVAAGCAGGPEVDLIEPPIVELAAESVSIALMARYVEGQTGCEKGGCGVLVPTILVVSLPEALGSRSLLDRSIFPARDALLSPFNTGCGG